MKNKIHPDFFKLIISFILLTTSLSAYAVDDDKNQPLYVQADTVSIDNKIGQSQYTGNVDVRQGNSHLTADKAVVYLDKNNTIKEAIAYGSASKQAHYETITDPKKPELNAYADTIHMYPQEHLVYLIGHAHVTQGADSYAAPEIQYNSLTQRVFSKQSTQGRTVIVIHPNENKSKPSF